MYSGGWKRVLRVIACSIICAVGIGAWVAPPAQASDAVQIGLAQVQNDKVILAKAEKHLHWATRHHYHVAGLHRWLRRHVTRMTLTRQLRMNVHHAARLQKLVHRYRWTGWKVQHWGVVRTRLHRKIASKQANLDAATAWVQGVIERQAAYQSRRADAVLRHIAKDKKNPGEAISGQGVGVRAVREALTQLGVPYVWGGETPGKGFDCSGLVKWAYAQEGVSLVHFAATQATEGTPVSISQLQPGDLVFFERPIGHVAMYVGDGLLIEAPQTGDVVHLTRLDDSWHVDNFQIAVRPS